MAIIIKAKYGVYESYTNLKKIRRFTSAVNKWLKWHNLRARGRRHWWYHTDEIDIYSDNISFVQE